MVQLTGIKIYDQNDDLKKWNKKIDIVTFFKYNNIVPTFMCNDIIL